MTEQPIKRIFELFSGIPLTIIAGVFLGVSLIFLLEGITLPVDPAWITVVICGYPLLYLAVWRMIYNKGMSKISSALLISMAMAASVIIGELFAAGEVAFIMAIGAILEDKTVERAKKGIRQLMSFSPDRGRVIIDGKEEMVPIEQVKIGDILRVLPGEAIPVDGEILYGNTSVDQSIITGESMPVDKAAGDIVFCGTTNRFGSIDMKATNVGEDSSLQKLIRLVQEAENNKAPVQRIADRWATWLVPAVLAIAAITYLFTADAVRAVTILVVFCPCALALATPTSVVAAIGQAAKHGVIIKSGDALERMAKVDCVAVDKTGTLTRGDIIVSDAMSFDPGITENGLLLLAASAEAYSEHPLGKAVVSMAKERGLTIQPAEDFKMVPGKGIGANVCGRRILCGSSEWLKENGISVGGDAVFLLEGLHRQGKATVLVSDGAECKGVIALSDTLRDAAKSMVLELGRMNTDVVLLTGDNVRAAEHFALEAGIASVRAGLLPAKKAEHILQLQNEGRNVCMIGDGVNDAPALKTADVGVAMGSIGSDIAIEAADIALMGDEIEKIAYIKRLSNATVRLIRINISISMIINFFAVTFAVFALLNPITGALVHNAGSVLVVLNAALLYDRKYI